jgi:hypothetical protein
MKGEIRLKERLTGIVGRVYPSLFHVGHKVVYVVIVGPL